MADPTTESQAVTATTASDAAPAHAPESQTAAPEASTTPATSAEAKPGEGEAAKTGDKPADDAKPAEVTYEFKVPEGFDPNTEGMNELKATAKELGLTPEQAQRIADLGVKQAQGFTTQLVEQQKAMTAQWAEQTTTDKEIGGDKLPENLGVAKKALDTFGSKELKTLLNESGLGNHPEIVRFMVKAGKAISEDGQLITGSAAQKDRANTPIENRLYPNQN
jgi:Spy/CpxP family protein refolding chaperone